MAAARDLAGTNEKVIAVIGDGSMTGGMAFVYDPHATFQRRANPDSIVWQRLASAHWEGVLKDLVERHAKATDSKWSKSLLADWDRIAGDFWQVIPKEMLSRQTHPLDDTVEAVAAE